MPRLRMGLFPRLFGSFLLVVLFSLSSAGYLVARSVREAGFAQVEERLSYEVTMTGQMLASALFAPLAPGDATLQAPIKDLSDAVHTHLSLLTPDGVVVADSEGGTSARAEPERVPADVARALAVGRGSAVSSERGNERLWVAERISRDGQVLGIARASVPTSVIEQRVDAVEKQIAIASLIALGLGVLTALGLSLSIVRPVRRVADAARSIGSGALTTRVEISSSDEIGDLGKALNEMASQLESMLDDLSRGNADMRRVLDTVDQGLVMVAADGRLSEERSARLSEWFGTPAAGACLWDFLGQADHETHDRLYMAWSQLSDSGLPLALLLDQLPKRIRSGARAFDLDCRPVLAQPEVLESVLLVVTDITQRLEGEKRETLHRDVLRVVERAMSDRMGVLEFLQEADDLVAELSAPTTTLVAARRALHTLKGNCAMQGIASIAQLSHEIEERLDETAAFDAADLSALVARWAELREGVLPVLGSPDAIHLHSSVITSAVSALLAGEQRGKLAERMIRWTLPSVDTAIARLAEHARALAQRLDKGPIDVCCETDGTPLQGERWPAFWSAMTHAVRNAVDHGLEHPDERARQGKPELGSIAMSARMLDDELVIQLADDGRGVDWAAVADKLRRAGQPAETREQLTQGLFLDGISTAQEATTISGRGVGMGALRAAVVDLGGRIEIDSGPGSGTTLSCRFPRTAAGAVEWSEPLRRNPGPSELDNRSSATGGHAH